MSVTVGPNVPTTNSQSGSGKPWTNPQNAYASDNVYAVSSLSSSFPISQIVLYAGFGFNIPSNATINGITVTVEGFRSSNTNTFSAQLAPSGTPAGNQVSTAFTTTETVHTLGGSSDLWGLTPTAASLNSSAFGVALGPHVWNSGLGGTQTSSVDAVTISVTYTPFGVSQSVIATVTFSATDTRGIGKYFSSSVNLTAALQRGIGKHLPVAAYTLSSSVAKGLSKVVTAAVNFSATVPFLRASAARLGLKRFRVWIWVEQHLNEDEWI